jgi:hypothetical protein
MIDELWTYETSCFDELGMNGQLQNDAKLSFVHPELVEG